MSKSPLKPEMLCFLVGKSVWPYNRNKIVKLLYLTMRRRKTGIGTYDMVTVWRCQSMQPLQMGPTARLQPAGGYGHARPHNLRPIDPDGTVTQTEVNELWTTYEEPKVPA